MYPKWKLLRLDEFNGTLGQVFIFLDGINGEPQDVYRDLGYKKLPDEAESLAPQRIQLARDVSSHVQRICEFAGRGKLTPEQLIEKRKIEKSGLEDLHKKYPYNGFDKILSEPRLKNI